MAERADGWRLTTTANVIAQNGAKATLGWVIRVADEAEARRVMSQQLGGIKQFHAEPLSAEDVEDYGLKDGEWKQL